MIIGMRKTTKYLASAAFAVSVMLAVPGGAMPPTARPQKDASGAPADSGRDFSGVWTMHPLASQRHYINSTYTQDGPDMTAWAKQRFEETKPSNGPRTHTLQETNDPVLKYCLPPGVPRIYLQPLAMQIVQTPKEVILLYEYDHTVRRIYTDGRQHRADLTPTYMGDSIGHWEGDTLVADTIGFNDKTWLDRDGHVHSDELHVTERFQLADRDHLQIAIMMEDPKALAKPWVATLYYELKPNWDILEQDCTDNWKFLKFEK
jgi:hypothetical protein